MHNNEHSRHHTWQLLYYLPLVTLKGYVTVEQCGTTTIRLQFLSHCQGWGICFLCAACGGSAFDNTHTLYCLHNSCLISFPGHIREAFQNPTHLWWFQRLWGWVVLAVCVFRVTMWIVLMVQTGDPLSF